MASLCLHEAGHMIAARHFGLEPQRGGYAIVLSHRGGYAAYRDHDDAEVQAVVTLSGIAAEAVFVGRVRNGIADREKAGRLLGLTLADNRVVLATPSGRAALDVMVAHKTAVVCLAGWCFAWWIMARWRRHEVRVPFAAALSARLVRAHPAGAGARPSETKTQDVRPA